MEINIAPAFNLHLQGGELRIIRKALRDLANKPVENESDREMVEQAEAMGERIITQLKAHAETQVRNLEGAKAK
jgi:hypothetical protein